ncbi:hypothetical protein BH20ACI4_BH20ACI4_16090 [soil metagenome]
MKRFMCLIFLLVGFSTFVFSQNTESERKEKEITICPVKLLVGAADFRFSYRYIVKTNDKGEINKIEQLGKNENPKFIKDEDFIPCMESWKLNPSEDYFISFNIGTIFTKRYKNYISISNKTDTIKIILPNIEGAELVIEDKKKQ